MHEILTAAGNLYKTYPCNIKNLNAADILQIFFQISSSCINFHEAYQISHELLQLLRAIKIWSS